MYFWANGIDWTTEDTADLDAYEEFMVDQLAPHMKAFDSYPGYQFAEGNWRCRTCGTAMPAKGSTRSKTRADTRGAWARR